MLPTEKGAERSARGFKFLRASGKVRAKSKSAVRRFYSQFLGDGGSSHGCATAELDHKRESVSGSKTQVLSLSLWKKNSKLHVTPTQLQDKKRKNSGQTQSRESENQQRPPACLLLLGCEMPTCLFGEGAAFRETRLPALVSVSQYVLCTVRGGGCRRVAAW